MRTDFLAFQIVLILAVVYICIATPALNKALIGDPLTALPEWFKVSGLKVKFI